ncbi:hypothetical protein Octan_055 [Acinetobacter phage Octan]|uniref:Uncharacterized protein n=3 Tax=Lazarusvirus TaxID=2842820 RepID=A0A4Y1NL80_9CAUD|nr:hypothetical protein HYP65_gp055 [Acinetobacter phage AM101]QKE55757.1 hypothetical protein Octan_055 [Acinetobacter phage Octan]QNO11176.1 hypothetical protein Meroveus_055 [Acinetobacter phage Meroveus]UJH94848.1 hypothetical protein PhaR5_113 [Acinetobacter phage PhaR5]WBF78866.1 hypothetical protein ADLP2_062 [Acinetobacter phage vB_AbaM_DLP2]CAH1068523.1 Uncharacterised protein [Acinetobacter phage MD-2021a]
MSTPKIENVVVKIIRVVESSGNVQFFLRATRLDVDEPFGNNLEYQCFQTNKNGHKLTEHECIENALFGAIMFLRFFGHKGSDLKFQGFTEENMKSVEEAKLFWRAAERKYTTYNS